MTITDEEVARLGKAMAGASMPANPIPFAQGIANYVRSNGSKSINSDEAKRLLWVLMAQAYGELATIDLTEEYRRLITS